MISYHDLIHHLGELLDESLFPNSENVVRFMINNEINFQLETDITQENLLITAEIFELPPGSFRDDVLMNVIKANHNIQNFQSNLAWISRDSLLVVFLYIPLYNSTVEKLYTIIEETFKRAKDWRDALNNTRTAPDSELTQKQVERTPSLFNFKPPT